VLALPLPLAFAWLLHRILPEKGRDWGVPAPLARLVADHRRLRRDLDEIRGESDPIAEPGRDKRVRRLHTRARTQHAVQKRTVWALRGAIGLALAAGLLVMSPARLAVALFGLWLVRRTRLSTLRVVAAVFAALVVAVAAERFTAPDPLPDATVRATNGALVKGPLVAATGDAWHVVVADRRVKSVPNESIAKASVYSESRLVRGPLGGRLIDVFR
jgi:anti-sigma factor RsiW